MDVGGRVKLTNISCRQLVSVRRDVDPRRYTHLSPDVLTSPGTSYTHTETLISLTTDQSGP